MATAPAVTLSVKADTSHVIAAVDVIVKHLAALRDELAELERDGDPGPFSAIHAWPPESGAPMPCCGRVPSGLYGDRCSQDPSLVTCGGA
jgi:hypothetical protein